MYTFLTSDLPLGFSTDSPRFNLRATTIQSRAVSDRNDPDNLDKDKYGDEQMEEDNNEGGCNDENDDLGDNFLIDTSIFNR